MNIESKLSEMAEKSVNRDSLELHEADGRVRHFKMGFRAALELPEVKELVEAAKRRMKSDDACDLPYAEDLGAAIQAFEDLCTPDEGE